MNLVNNFFFGSILIISVPLLEYWSFYAGVIWEFVIEVDADLKFQWADNRKKLVVNLSHLSILSQQIEETLQNNIQIPHFSSNLPSHLVAGELASGSQHAKGVQTDSNASNLKHPGSDFSGNSHVAPFCFSCQHYILKNLGASLSIEKICSDHVGLLSKSWAGKGSMSGLDLTLSHSEILVGPTFLQKALPTRFFSLLLKPPFLVLGIYLGSIFLFLFCFII